VSGGEGVLRVFYANRGAVSRPDTASVPSFEAYAGTAPENDERYFVPAIGRPLAHALVDLAEVRPEQRVLDVACGTGIVASVAAERVGAEGLVAGVDINPGMLAVARSTPASGAPISWYEAPADALPFPDGAFDIVPCQLGLQFFPDRLGALREMRRVLAPSGRTLVLVPGAVPEIFAILEEALAAHYTPTSPRSCRSSSRSTNPTSFEASWPTPASADPTRAPTPRRSRCRRRRSSCGSTCLRRRWRPFTQQGRLLLKLGFSVASGER
jgi:SAM-dependent methyltransferase